MTKTNRKIKLTRVSIVSVAVILLVVAAVGAKSRFVSQKGFVMSLQEGARVRAPELTGGRGWLNTDKPLSIAALKGKVILLDFWTYGCINCIHIIPDLKKLEAKYANQLVVIGVHSAKFQNEKETENIRRIILRYELEHPVYNDADFKVWQSYGVKAWPTQILIDPAGYIVGGTSGEGHYDVYDQAIEKLIKEFRQRGELNEEPLKMVLERTKIGDLPLAFPGKIIADADGDRLFIADSNHNRIVVTKLDGTLAEVIGTGETGATDGSFDRATFYRPQGLVRDGDSLFVADTENHLIRRINLKTRTVETVAGTGKQNMDYPSKGGPARTTAISSPWDLQLVGRNLYIAMAGPHQIWKFDLDKNQVTVFAGSGREARKDGSLGDAGFAQPSGLATDGKTLYVADSESNIIRAIGLNTGQVNTLVGGDLFDFGDVDGEGNDVRLQHPLGLTWLGDKVLIADTYNHKIKELDPRRQTVKTVFGTGKPGQSDGNAPSFYEPGGLTAVNGKLYVADTNNHAVRVIDLKTKQTTTLRIKGLMPPTRAVETTDEATGPNAEESKVSKQQLRTGAGSLVISVELPTGYHLNPAAPQRYSITVNQGSSIKVDEKLAKQSSKDLKLPIRVPLQVQSEGSSILRVQTTLYYCRDDNTGTCRIKTLFWNLPVDVVSDNAAPIELKVDGKVE